MIPKLYDRNNNYIGKLTECSRAIVIEERNGMFELEIDYQLFSPCYEQLIRGNIIVADANDKLKNQMFRIYKTTKNIFGHFSVYARHISYDISRDYCEGLNIENQSCEYCLNELFRNSHFSQNFVGKSDIVNAQNYNIGQVNLLSAIAGERGSILDTFGTGAEILRDNYDFHVLNKRGHDNDVVIKYASNLTGLDYEECEDGLITKIRAIATYTPTTIDSEGNEVQGTETTIHTYVESPNIDKYETPFIGEIDFSEKFGEKEVPTIEKLTKLAQKYFKDNKCDIMKYNYKIEFVPLSKCAGYNNIEDKIELCDTVTIIDYRYNLNTKAKVIKTTYNLIKDRYDSMELGEPRTTLSDIVVGTGGEQGPPGEPGKDGAQGPQGPQGEKGETGDVELPDELPDVPVLSATVLGFASISLEWTFENKLYYSYELYASKTPGFTPNTFDLIHQGQTSSFLFQAKPDETWYFRVCAINSYGNRTNFSPEISVSTMKAENMNLYFSDNAIGHAVARSLSADYMEAGIIKGHWIDAKNLSVTDGNGKRTLDIDSFGNVNLNVASLSILSTNVGSSISDLNNKYAQLRVDVDGISLTGAVTFYDLSTSGRTEIHGGNIKSGTITANQIKSATITADEIAGNTITAAEIASGAITTSELAAGAVTASKIAAGAITADKIAAKSISVDKLSSNNANPVITLFDHCEIDASYLNGEGKGSAIRLKWDDENYVYVGKNNILFFLTNGNEGRVLSITGDTSQATLSNQNGYALKLADSLSYRGSTVLTSGNYSSYCATSGHSHSWNQITGKPSSFTPSSHTHEYQDRIINGGGKIQCYSNYVVMDAGYSCNVRLDCGYSGGGNYKFYAVSSGTDLGSGSYKWRYVFSQNALQTSDVKYKENIQYLDDGISTFRLRGRIQTPFLDFIRDSFRPATYDYKVAREEEGHVEADRQLGFIANDIIDTEVGQTFLYNFGTEDETDIMFSSTGYTTVVARALQEEVRVRDSQIEALEIAVEESNNKISELEAKLALLEQKLDALLNS